MLHTAEPRQRATPPDDQRRLLDVLAGLQGDHRLAVVLSGAGLSTDSGIPDYRGPTGMARRVAPMQYRDFVRDPAARQRYWARSHVGWAAITQARPNGGHHAVADLQRAGVVGTVITQNVDGLHQRAGAADVVDLHGRLDAVVCLECGDRSSRRVLDRRLDEANPGFRRPSAGRQDAERRPDGDADLSAVEVQGFRMVDCLVCGGLLKPDVVFFGESVPKDRVERCYEAVGAADVLLVLGSSLTVMSGLRFVRSAAQGGRTVTIVNQGATRGDDLASVRVDAPLGQVLPWLAARLTAGPGGLDAGQTGDRSTSRS